MPVTPLCIWQSTRRVHEGRRQGAGGRRQEAGDTSCVFKKFEVLPCGSSRVAAACPLPCKGSLLDHIAGRAKWLAGSVRAMEGGRSHVARTCRPAEPHCITTQLFWHCGSTHIVPLRSRFSCVSSARRSATKQVVGRGRARLHGVAAGRRSRCKSRDAHGDISESSAPVARRPNRTMGTTGRPAALLCIAVLIAAACSLPRCAGQQDTGQGGGTAAAAHPAARCAAQEQAGQGGSSNATHHPSAKKKAPWRPPKHRPCKPDDARCVALRDHICDPYFVNVTDK